MLLYTTSGRHVAAADLETVHAKINGDRLEAGQQFAVDNVFVTVDNVNFIRVFGLVQSQCQGRTTSSAGTVIYPDGRFFNTLKIFGELFDCRRRYV